MPRCDVTFDSSRACGTLGLFFDNFICFSIAINALSTSIAEAEWDCDLHSRECQRQNMEESKSQAQTAAYLRPIE